MQEKLEGCCDGSDNQTKTDHEVKLSSNPLFKENGGAGTNPALLAMQSRDMDEASNSPVFGNGRCSLGYNMFDGSSSIIKELENDLVSLMEEAVKSKIYLADSF